MMNEFAPILNRPIGGIEESGPTQSVDCFLGECQIVN